MADPGPILEGLKPVLVQIPLAQSWRMRFVLGAKGKRNVEVPGWAAISQGPAPGQQGARLSLERRVLGREKPPTARVSCALHPHMAVPMPVLGSPGPVPWQPSQHSLLLAPLVFRPRHALNKHLPAVFPYAAAFACGRGCQNGDKNSVWFPALCLFFPFEQ